MLHDLACSTPSRRLVEEDMDFVWEEFPKATPKVDITPGFLPVPHYSQLACFSENTASNHVVSSIHEPDHINQFNLTAFLVLVCLTGSVLIFISEDGPG